MHTHNFLYDLDSNFGVYNLDLYENLFIPEKMYFSAALHPWSVKNQFAKWYLYMLEKIARHDFCIAIGECGLDYKKNIDRDLQKDIFENQIKLAEDFNLPLILHVVAAHNDVISLKKKYNSDIAWIIHGFNSSEIILNQLIDNGFYLSVSEQFLNTKSTLLNNIPIDKLFLETDDKDIEIEDLYNISAEILNLTVEELIQQISKNFEKCFKLKI